MRVTWKEYFDNSNYDPEDYRVWTETYVGEVVGTVRSWGTTRLVVMLDTGKMREVNADRVEKAPPKEK